MKDRFPSTIVHSSSCGKDVYHTCWYWVEFSPV